MRALSDYFNQMKYCLIRWHKKKLSIGALPRGPRMKDLTWVEPSKTPILSCARHYVAKMFFPDSEGGSQNSAHFGQFGGHP